jgi:hypothetical protein
VDQRDIPEILAHQYKNIQVTKLPQFNPVFTQPDIKDDNEPTCF